MKKFISTLFVLLLVAMMTQGGVLPQTAVLAERNSSVQVSINAPAEVTAGGSFTATIDISQVENFDACNYDVSFDPTVLEIPVLEIIESTTVYDITNGQIDGATIPVDVTNMIHVGSGPADLTVIRVVQNISGLTGASGSGYLAKLHFHVIGSSGNSSDISLSNGMLSNILAKEISAALFGDFVEVLAIRGDANGDGKVNALDITYMERIIAGLDPPFHGADANQDCNLNVVDVTKIERIIAKLD